MATTATITVRHGLDTVLPVEIDPSASTSGGGGDGDGGDGCGSEAVEVFRLQVSSLLPAVARTEDVELHSLATGSMLMRTPPTAGDEVAVLDASAKFVNRVMVAAATAPTAGDDGWAAAAAADACSRVYAGRAEWVQPAFVTPTAPAARLCVACAHTCVATAQPAPVPMTAAGNPAPFSCQCSARGECLFAPRYGLEALPSAMETAVRAHLHTLAMRLVQGPTLAQVVRTGAARYPMAVAGLQSTAGRLQAAAAAVLRYAQPAAIHAALRTIPVALLVQRVQQRVGSSGAAGSAGGGGVGGGCGGWEEELLAQLVQWFKRDFFGWVNSLPCASCGSAETEAVGGTAPNAEERAGQAGVVEVHRCRRCHATTRFPRYNDPVRLLTWRKGRCGEWANCFTLCALAVGLTARHVVDWTDHVWCEVWSPRQRRWLHVDPCEAAIDTPLVYEAGWGKKLSYIVAFGLDEVVDVTRRYTRQWPEVASRRTAVPEDWFASAVAALDVEQRSRYLVGSDVMRQQAVRRSMELRCLEGGVWDDGVRLQGELHGRITGSLEWRQARGETGTTSGGVTTTSHAGSVGSCHGGWSLLQPACAQPTTAATLATAGAGSTAGAGAVTPGGATSRVPSIGALSCFGTHLLALDRDGLTVLWKPVPVASDGGASTATAPWQGVAISMLSCGAGGDGGEGVVVTPALVPWPWGASRVAGTGSCPPRIVALAAEPGAMRMYAITTLPATAGASGHGADGASDATTTLWCIQHKTVPARDSAVGGGADGSGSGSGGTGKRGWVATRIGGIQGELHAALHAAKGGTGDAGDGVGSVPADGSDVAPHLSWDAGCMGLVCCVPSCGVWRCHLDGWRAEDEGATPTTSSSTDGRLRVDRVGPGPSTSIHQPLIALALPPPPSTTPPSPTHAPTHILGLLPPHQSGLSCQLGTLVAVPPSPSTSMPTGAVGDGDAGACEAQGSWVMEDGVTGGDAGTVSWPSTVVALDDLSRAASRASWGEEGGGIAFTLAFPPMWRGTPHDFIALVKPGHPAASSWRVAADVWTPGSPMPHPIPPRVTTNISATAVWDDTRHTGPCLYDLALFRGPGYATRLATIPAAVAVVPTRTLSPPATWLHLLPAANVVSLTASRTSVLALTRSGDLWAWPLPAALTRAATPVAAAGWWKAAGDDATPGDVFMAAPPPTRIATLYRQLTTAHAGGCTHPHCAANPAVGCLAPKPAMLLACQLVARNSRDVLCHTAAGDVPPPPAASTH